MTKEYLKMSDAFVHNDIASLEQHIYAGYMSKPCCEYAAHAINSHDELVAENERLREFERDAMRYHFLRDNCTIQQADSCGPIFVMTIRRKDNLFNIGLSIDEAMDERKTNG